MENPDYYSQVRNNVRYFMMEDTTLTEEEAAKQVKQKIQEHFGIITRPVDKRENYIKRGVGMPGDVLEIKHSQLYVNGELAVTRNSYSLNMRLRPMEHL